MSPRCAWSPFEMGSLSTGASCCFLGLVGLLAAVDELEKAHEDVRERHALLPVLVSATLPSSASIVASSVMRVPCADLRSLYLLNADTACLFGDVVPGQ
jgi:hypothetical protein